MRISADTKSSDFSRASVFAKVYLDGAPIYDCVTADEESGTADCYQVVNGRTLVNGCGDVSLQTLHGEVRIDLSDCTLAIGIVGLAVFQRAREDRARAAA